MIYDDLSECPRGLLQPDAVRNNPKLPTQLKQIRLVSR